MFWRRKKPIVIETEPKDTRPLEEVFGEDNLYEGTMIQLGVSQRFLHPSNLVNPKDLEEELSNRGLFKSVSTATNLQPSPTLFIPTSMSEYIGQLRAKKILSSYLSATQKRQTIFPHTLIHGKPGMGKTSLAVILANSLHKQLTQQIASNITERGQLVDIINSLDGNILFLDEIHALPRNMIEPIYQMMEQFQCNGIPINPFTIIGATTELGEIIKNRRPFYDRFKIIVELEDYTIPDLTKIGKQYKQRVFPNDVIDKKYYALIAKNSRLTPRTVIRLVEATTYFNGDIQTVLKNFGIIKWGYTEKDRKLLKYLTQHQVVGLQGIAAFLDTSLENYLYEIEPYLVKNEIVIRTPRGRAISTKGKQLLKKLER